MIYLLPIEETMDHFMLASSQLLISAPGLQMDKLVTKQNDLPNDQVTLPQKINVWKDKC